MKAALGFSRALWSMGKLETLDWNGLQEARYTALRPNLQDYVTDTSSLAQAMAKTTKQAIPLARNLNNSIAAQKKQQATSTNFTSQVPKGPAAVNPPAVVNPPNNSTPPQSPAQPIGNSAGPNMYQTKD